jgi:hypothetical protein
MMLLHFRLSFLDHLIGYRRTVAGQSLCYDDVHHLSPLLSQSNKGKAFRGHPLDGLYDNLEPNDVEVRIKISNHPIIGRPSIECF